MTQTITVIRGDGIGPEIMDATLFVLDALQAGLTYEYADAAWSRWKSTAICCLSPPWPRSPRTRWR